MSFSANWGAPVSLEIASLSPMAPISFAWLEPSRLPVQPSGISGAVGSTYLQGFSYRWPEEGCELVQSSAEEAEVDIDSSETLDPIGGRAKPDPEWNVEGENVDEDGPPLKLAVLAPCWTKLGRVSQGCPVSGYIVVLDDGMGTEKARWLSNPDGCAFIEWFWKED